MDENPSARSEPSRQQPRWPAAEPATGSIDPGPPAGQAGRRNRRPIAIAAVAGALAAALALGGVAVDRYVADDATTGTAGTATAAQDQSNGWSAGTGIGIGPGAGWPGGSAGGGTDLGAGTGSTGTTRAATGAEQAGVVTITTVLGYGAGEAAGTGIVLTASGEILTNNHVIDDATSITVTVVGTGTSYAASVVGTDPTDDIAVLRLTGASGLTTATLANPVTMADLAVGDAVTAVGNAGGTGSLTAATGTVVALDQDITASDETGTDAEQLTGLIQVDAAIEAGDSGGPLYADGLVVGIDTAASSGRTATSAGFAIPISTATAIAERIASGEDSGTIHQGYPAFLGVELAGAGDAGGLPIAGVVPGSPAAAAGLQAGDTITEVDGTAVGTTDALSAVLGAHEPGDRVGLTWTDAAGAAHTATVTLAAGPAD